MPVSQEDFKRALGSFASSVTVVTLRSADGQPTGITVTAFSSLSLEPPLVLICIDHRARVHDEFRDGGAFAVNLLAEDQESLSRRFASRPDKFAGIAHHDGQKRAPLLDGTMAAVECRIVGRHPGGDHTIFVGEVEASHVTDASPLLHFRGRYGKFA